MDEDAAGTPPENRVFPAMFYDAGCKQVLLFGGDPINTGSDQGLVGVGRNQLDAASVPNETERMTTGGTPVVRSDGFSPVWRACCQASPAAIPNHVRPGDDLEAGTPLKPADSRSQRPDAPDMIFVVPQSRACPWLS